MAAYDGYPSLRRTSRQRAAAHSQHQLAKSGQENALIPAALKESDFVKAFLLLMLCSVIGGVLAGGVVGALLGAAVAAVGGSMSSVQIAAPILGAFTGIGISYFFFRWLVLRAHYSQNNPFAGYWKSSRCDLMIFNRLRRPGHAHRSQPGALTEDALAPRRLAPRQT